MPTKLAWLVFFVFIVLLPAVFGIHPWTWIPGTAALLFAIAAGLREQRQDRRSPR
jgi:hypothetical protein